jgi:uncharacterized SAM-binding protein YcdF (DUF218 family)
MNALIILLGCAIDHIAYDRVNSGINFALSQNDTQITWFLTGGIKNPDSSEDRMSEAEKMGNRIKYYDPSKYDNSQANLTWNYIYDTLSTNTAENLVRVQQLLDTSITTYDNIYIVTSDFHYNRVNAMAKKIIDPEIQIDWILSPVEERDSRYWENIHIKNVDTDVTNALLKIRNRIL